MISKEFSRGFLVLMACFAAPAFSQTREASSSGELLDRIAATVNDCDSAEQKDPTALGLFGGIAPTKDSEKFGLLLLGK